MTADFLKYFYTNDFDNKIILKSKDTDFTVFDIKNLVAKKIGFLKTVKKDKIILGDFDNLTFIINFLACVFSKKEIIIIDDYKKTKNMKDAFVLEMQTSAINNVDFEKIKPQEIFINMFTSGSAGVSKCVKKSLKNLISESNDLFNELDFKNVEIFASTTSLNHLFGLTFHFMLPINCGFCIFSDKINSLENSIKDKTTLISTPSFLEKTSKYEKNPAQEFEKIITAGARLKDDEFNFALNAAKEVIEIYGSTESGVIAYRKSPKAKLKLFKNVKIIKSVNTLIKTDYSCESPQISGDDIKLLKNREIELLGRTDRILKINEKRICAREIEYYLEKNKFVKEAYCLNVEGKIGVMIALTQHGFDFIFKYDILKLKKELRIYLKKYFEILPKKFKFIDEIPKNQRGKFDKDKISKIFSLNFSYPLIVDRKIKDDVADFKIYFYRHADFFKGHFEKFPILAGVVELLFASMLTDDVFEVSSSVGQIKKIKFSKIIFPNKIVNLKLEKLAHGFSFKYYKDDKLYSSGMLPFTNYLKG